MHFKPALLIFVGAVSVFISGCNTTSVRSEKIIEDNGVHEYQFQNGLKLIVKEDHRAPIVVSQVWYKVGSSYEMGGTTGVSHVLEHMMFQGTTRHGPGEFSKIISENGGQDNAFTGSDYTAYFQTLEKSRLEVSFALESDRMRNLVIQDEKFQKEINVVMEERRMRTEDNPQAFAFERFSAAAHVNSGYHHPIIGWMDDLENMNVDDLAQWYQKWYAPNNATVVVVGDVEPEAVRYLGEKYFARLKPSVVAPPKPRKEIEPKGERRIEVKIPAKLPYLYMGYPVPSLKTARNEWEVYALDVLAGILDGGSSARFEKELVREQAIATTIGAGYDAGSRMDDLFVFSGTPTNKHSVADLELAVQMQIDRVKTEPVSDAELDRVKAQVLAEDVYEKDSVFYQAMQIGMLETVGLDWRKMNDYVSNIEAVTKEQIMEVAKKYFVKEHLVVAELVPVSGDETEE